MEIDEYKKLPLNDRADMLWENGVLVDQRAVYNKHTISIYSLFTFYVEVYYSVHDNSIVDIKAIDSEKDWEGYLDSINLNHLMK